MDDRICDSLQRSRNEGANSIQASREVDLTPEGLIPRFSHSNFLRRILQSVASSAIPVAINNDAATDGTEKHIGDLTDALTPKLVENRTADGMAPFCEHVRRYDNLNIQIRVAAPFAVWVMDEPFACCRKPSSLGGGLN